MKRYAKSPKIREERLKLYKSLSAEAQGTVFALAMVLRNEVKVRNPRAMFGEKDALELAMALLQFLAAGGEL